MAWNYRIFKKTINDREYYCLKEAYYNDSGDIVSVTEDTMTGWFEDFDHLKGTHEMMCKDIVRFEDKILEEDQLFD
jgi:hypothetical protein